MSKFEEEFEAFFKAQKISFIRNDKNMFGTPDFSFGDGKIVLFLHGCYWHSHNCKDWQLDKIWQSRMNSTKQKDILVREKYLSLNIRYLRCWECEYLLNKAKIFHKTLKVINESLSHPDNSKTNQKVL